MAAAMGLEAFSLDVQIIARRAIEEIADPAMRWPWAFVQLDRLETARGGQWPEQDMEAERYIPWFFERHSGIHLYQMCFLSADRQRVKVCDIAAADDNDPFAVSVVFQIEPNGDLV